MPEILRFRAFSLVREAGVEPARPEWTLEPELKKERFSLYREVDSNAV